MLVNYSLFAGPAIVLGIGAACFAVLSIIAVVRSQRRKVAAGRETMIGQTAVVQTPLQPEGTVRIDGELWNAVARGAPIQAGERVTIVSMDGLNLMVRKKEVTDV
jgi:membrane-bound serine protease (ClpP class)